MEIPTCRRPTLLHQLAMMDSSNLRDLLRVREAEDEIHRHSSGRLGGTVTLATVLAFEKRDDSSTSSAAESSRSLLEIIRDDDDARGLLGRHEQNNGGSHRICWKSFRERLRLHRATAAWSSSTTQSPTVISIINNTGSDLDRQSLDPPAVRPPLDNSTGGSARRQPETEQTRVSLMALLEQTDTTGNIVDNHHESSTIAAAMIGMVEEEEAMERKKIATGLATETIDDIGGVDRGMHICCVCMVRHKGSAFIPCGHTFCRLCSRELWVSRGSCPLCNAFILEILDIF